MHCITVKTFQLLHSYFSYLSAGDMAIASGPAGLVLAGLVFTVIFGTAHVQIMNNEYHVWG